VSGSTRLVKEPSSPIPALQRFDGVFMRLIRKYKGKLRGVDILIVSPVYGSVMAEEEIGFKEPLSGSWRKLVLSNSQLARLRESSLSTLQKLLTKRHYDEIYVNVGKNMLKIIEGFDETALQKTKITYAQGKGIGPKMSHMKNWMESIIPST